MCLVGYLRFETGDQMIENSERIGIVVDSTGRHT